MDLWTNLDFGSYFNRAVKINSRFVVSQFMNVQAKQLVQVFLCKLFWTKI